MSTIKSYSVGNGDMFYIDHNSDNFTMIDCCLSNENKGGILFELEKLAKQKKIRRFISTHPDEDHIQGIESLFGAFEILNFYCVSNECTKDDESSDFDKYCELRDSGKAFNIEKDCTRKWMNLSDDDRGSSGISILWPDIENEKFQNALENAKNGDSPNNISPVIRYKFKSGASVLWMGDLETEFMESIEDDITFDEIDILIAPHHGRNSGKVPKKILDQLNPKIIVIGEAPSVHLNYYNDYNTITQNTAGDIIFECDTGKVDIFVSNENYTVDFLDYDILEYFNFRNDNYLGTLILNNNF